jgi:uncharacterized membrane protein
MLAKQEMGARMKFSYSAVWDDALRLTRAHAPLLTAIAGVFIFLPALLFAVFLKPPEPQSADPNQMLRVILDYYAAIAPWLLLQGLISLVGTAAMLRLVFARGSTVGAALLFGLTLLPFYFLMSLLTSLMVGIGLILLIVPGLYLIGRLVPAPAVMVAENRRNPIDAIGRSFALTAGHGWAILGLVVIVVIVALVALGVAGAIFGIVFVLIAGRDLGLLLAAIVASALNSAFATLMVMLYAAIYRALSGSDSVAATFD